MPFGYFDESYRLGPPLELWNNMARCYLRLDRPDAAAQILEHYLKLENLPPDDRAEAEKQLSRSFCTRQSTLTTSTKPEGARADRAVCSSPSSRVTPFSTRLYPAPIM